MAIERLAHRNKQSNDVKRARFRDNEEAIINEMSTGEPTRDEVEKQLERMLQSETFRAAPKVSRLLELIVMDTLDRQAHKNQSEVQTTTNPLQSTVGSALDENRIGIEVFGRSPDWVPLDDNIVRQNMRNLRKRLIDYYAENADTISIEVPTGGGYRAYFNYSIHSNNHQYYVAGNERLFRGKLREAERLFEQASESHPLSYVGIAEVRLLLGFLTNDIGATDHPAPWGPPARIAEISAEDWAKRALSENPSIWQAHAVQGAIFSFRREWEQAQCAFDRAAQIDPIGIRSNPWYLMYLMARGGRVQALDITEKALAATVEDNRAILARNCCLYLSGECVLARQTLYGSSDRHNPFWRTMLALTTLADGDPRDAIFDNSDIRETGIATPWHQMPLLYGLIMYSYGRAGKTGKARKRLDYLMENASEQHFAIALGHLALDQPRQALTELERACDAHVPIMIWLHLLPMFKPLRGETRFDELIERMQLS